MMLEKAVNDSSYHVQSAALEALVAMDKEAGIAKAKELENEAGGNVINTIARIYMENHLPDAIPFVKMKISGLSAGMEKYSLISTFGDKLKDFPADAKADGLQLLEGIAEKDGTWWIRLSALRSLSANMNEPGVKEFFKVRASMEKHPQVKTFIDTQVSSNE